MKLSQGLRHSTEMAKERFKESEKFKDIIKELTIAADKGFSNYTINTSFLSDGEQELLEDWASEEGFIDAKWVDENEYYISW
jgi:hypothetical protein